MEDLEMLIPTGKTFFELHRIASVRDTKDEFYKRYRKLADKMIYTDPVKFITEMVDEILTYDVFAPGHVEYDATQISEIFMKIIGNYSFSSKGKSIEIDGKKYKLPDYVSDVISISAGKLLDKFDMSGFDDLRFTLFGKDE